MSLTQQPLASKFLSSRPFPPQGPFNPPGGGFPTYLPLEPNSSLGYPTQDVQQSAKKPFNSVASSQVAANIVQSMLQAKANATIQGTDFPYGIKDPRSTAYPSISPAQLQPYFYTSEEPPLPPPLYDDPSPPLYYQYYDQGPSLPPYQFEADALPYPLDGAVPPPLSQYYSPTDQIPGPEEVMMTYGPNVHEDEWDPSEESHTSDGHGAPHDTKTEQGPKSHPYHSQHQAPPGTPVVAPSPGKSYFESVPQASTSKSEEKASPVAGYQVIKLATGSPAHKAGIIPFFDYVIGADDVILTEDIGEFWHRLASKKGEGLLVTVYNSRQQTTRQVAVYPDDTWGEGGLFGCTVAWNAISGGYRAAREIIGFDRELYAGESSLKVGQFIIGVEEFPCSAAQRICCFAAPDELEYWAEQHQSSPFPQQDLHVLVYDVKENKIFKLKVGFPFPFMVSKPLQAVIPFGPELPRYTEGGPLRKAPQTTGKKDEKRLAQENAAQCPYSPGGPSDLESPYNTPKGSMEKEKMYPTAMVHLSPRMLIAITIMFVIGCMAVGIYCIVIFSITRRRANNPDLSFWIIVHGVRTLVLLPFCAIYLAFLLSGRLRRQDPVVQLGLMLTGIGAMFALAWLVVGSVWVFTQPKVREEQGLLYWSSFGVILAEYLYYSIWVSVLCFHAFDKMDKSDAAVDDMLAQMLYPQEDEFNTIP